MDLGFYQKKIVRLNNFGHNYRIDFKNLAKYCKLHSELSIFLCGGGDTHVSSFIEQKDSDKKGGPKKGGMQMLYTSQDSRLKLN